MSRGNKISWVKRAVLLFLCILLSACQVQAAGMTRQEMEDLVTDITDWNKKSLGVDKMDCLFSQPFSKNIEDMNSAYYGLAVGRLGCFEDYSSYLETLENFLSREYLENSEISSYKVTEWHKIALTALALGGDPTNLGKKEDGSPINLIADSVYYRGKTTSLGSQGIYGYVWALITVDSLRYKIPEDASDSRESIITAILQEQHEDGGFVLGDDKSDPELTAAALQALAPYYNSTQSYTYISGETGEQITKSVRQSVDAALYYLSRMQEESGDYSSQGVYTIKTAAQTLIALCTLGIDPLSDERFIKNGNTLVDALLSYKTQDGSFSYSRDRSMESSSIGVQHIFLSLCALYRYENGLRSLYDFREEMPEELKEQIQELKNQISTLTEENKKNNQEFLKELFEKYLKIPETERSYVYNFELLARAMDENEIQDTSEYLALFMGTNDNGKGHVEKAVKDELSMEVEDLNKEIEKASAWINEKTVSAKMYNKIQEITQRYDALGEYPKSLITGMDKLTSLKVEYEKKIKFSLFTILILSTLAVAALGGLYFTKLRHKGTDE